MPIETYKSMLRERGASAEKLEEIEQAARDAIHGLADEYDVEIDEKSEDLIVGELFEHAVNYTDAEVADIDGLHGSITSERSGRMDISFIIGAICGRDEPPADVYELGNAMVAEKYSGSEVK